VRDGAIVYEELETAADLPTGWGDEQEAGRYRLIRRNDDAVFGYAVGPHSWKRFLHPSTVTLWRARRTPDSVAIETADEEPPLLALFGVRSCDLHAIAVQDRVLLAGPFVDPYYAARRARIFTIAVNCGHFTPSTCFCVSMRTGPKVAQGFDLALTEVLEPGRHLFVVEVGSEAGEAVLREIPHRLAQPTDIEAAEQVVATTVARMGRTLDTAGLKEALYASLDHPHWDVVAGRCLNCGNCTMVCPTCFCFTVEDRPDLSGTVTERVRRLDVCFTTEFTYTAGRPLRSGARSRYRQRPRRLALRPA
jgi:ferredoxin